MATPVRPAGDFSSRQTQQAQDLTAVHVVRLGLTDKTVGDMAEVSHMRGLAVAIAPLAVRWRLRWRHCRP